MDSKHLVIIGSSYVPLILVVSIFLFNLTTLETKSQEDIQTAESIEKVKERVELEHRGVVVPYDNTIRSGIIAPGQTVNKTITLDHDRMFVFHGRATVDFHGPSIVKYWVETPSGQITHESPLISSVLVKANNYDSNFLGVLMEKSPPISQDMSGKLVPAAYARINDVEQLNLQNSVVLVKRGGEPAEDLSLIESNIAAKGANALIVYGDEPSISFGQLKADSTYEPKIPVVFITREDGLLLKQLAENNSTVNLSSTGNSAISLTTPTYEFRTINIELGTYKVSFHNEGPSDVEVVFDYFSHVEIMGCRTN